MRQRWYVFILDIRGPGKYIYSGGEEPLSGGSLNRTDCTIELFTPGDPIRGTIKGYDLIIEQGLDGSGIMAKKKNKVTFYRMGDIPELGSPGPK